MKWDPGGVQRGIPTSASSGLNGTELNWGREWAGVDLGGGGLFLPEKKSIRDCQSGSGSRRGRNLPVRVRIRVRVRVRGRGMSSSVARDVK